MADSPSTIESSSESEPDAGDSDYETGSEEEVEPDEPSPLPPNRPLDAIKAVEYDAVKAVWAKRRVILSGAVIRTALGEYWNVIKGIRDKWKAEMTVLQQASEKKEKAKVIEYERRAANQRKLLESCIRLTLKHGHPDIVEKYVTFPFDPHPHPPLLPALHVHAYPHNSVCSDCNAVWTAVTATYIAPAVNASSLLHGAFITSLRAFNTIVTWSIQPGPMCHAAFCRELYLTTHCLSVS